MALVSKVSCGLGAHESDLAPKAAERCSKVESLIP